MVNEVIDDQQQAVLSQMDNDTFAKYAADRLLAAALQKKQTGKIDSLLENEIFDIEKAADERNFNLAQELKKRLEGEQMKLLEEYAASRREQSGRAPAPAVTPTVVPPKGATPENLNALQTVFERDFARSGQATQQVYTRFSDVPSHLQPALKDFFDSNGRGRAQVYVFNDMKAAEAFIAAGKSLGLELRLLTVPPTSQAQASSSSSALPQAQAPQPQPPQPQPPSSSALPDVSPPQQGQQDSRQAASTLPASEVVAKARQRLDIQVQPPPPQSPREKEEGTAPSPRLGQTHRG